MRCDECVSLCTLHLNLFSRNIEKLMMIICLVVCSLLSLPRSHLDSSAQLKSFDENWFWSFISNIYRRSKNACAQRRWRKREESNEYLSAYTYTHALYSIRLYVYIYEFTWLAGTRFNSEQCIPLAPTMLFVWNLNQYPFAAHTTHTYTEHGQCIWTQK